MSSTELQRRIESLLRKDMPRNTKWLPWLAVIEDKVDVLASQFGVLQVHIDKLGKLVDELGKVAKGAVNERQSVVTDTGAGSSNAAGGVNRSVTKTKEKTK